MTARISLLVFALGAIGSARADDIPAMLRAVLHAAGRTRRGPRQLPLAAEVRRRHARHAPPTDWQKRRAEILTYWHGAMGAVAAAHREAEGRVRARRSSARTSRSTASRSRPRPAAPSTTPTCSCPTARGRSRRWSSSSTRRRPASGRARPTFRDFALQLAKRGFVTLSLGGDPNTYYPTKETCRIQPLSFHAYEAANCYNALANLPNVDPKRIGVVGHSYGGKWAMFAGCLYDKFACAAWSDPGIVFDEKRGNVNYWEPWYLGFDPS